MKIIVRNEDEQKLIQRFVDALHEDLLSHMEESDHKWASENNQDPYLWSDEYQFIQESLFEVKVEVDPSEKSLYVEDSSVITGNCSVCDAYTEGTIDGGSVTYEEYVHLMSEETRKDWLCETCWNEGREG